MPLISRPVKARGQNTEMYILLALLLSCLIGCTHLSPSVEGRDTLVCGRVRFVVDGKEVTWSAIFDRPTPLLYHVESQKFINRIELAGGGLFAEAIERDGTFSWKLPAGRYFIACIVPFQDDFSINNADDPGKNVFPGIAFKVDETHRPAYIGTLQITVSVRKDFMGNRRMTSKPSIEVVDEFEHDRLIAKDRHGVELEYKLMFPVPELEGVPFHPKVPDIPAVLHAVPWFLFTQPR